VIAKLKEYAKSTQDHLESEIKPYLSSLKTASGEYEAELKRAGISV
jgi:hypothetical protein